MKKSASADDDARQAAAQVREYMAALPADARRELKKMREAIQEAVPEATEGFSYKIPAFKLDGKGFVWYAAFQEHTSLYPMTDAIRKAFAAELLGYETSKGTIRFPLSRPLPVALVKRLVKAKLAEVRAKAGG